MIKVFLCDDHALIRRGIRDTLSDAADIEVVGEAGDYGELRALMREHTADVLVLDINLPGRSGLDEEDLAKARSFGIRGLHERATTVGGWIDLSSGRNGTTLILSVPLDAPDSAWISEPDTNKHYDPSQWADV